MCVAGGMLGRGTCMTGGVWHGACVVGGACRINGQ